MKIGFIQAHDPDSFIENEYPPLGIAYMASYLRKYGFDEVFYAKRLPELLEKKPDIVAISSVSQKFKVACKIAKVVKEKTNAAVVIGGIHITFLPHMLPSEMDIGVIGEGEGTILELARKFDGTGWPADGLSDIKGICYHGEDGLVKITPSRDQIKPLDEIPFPDRDIVGDQWGRSFKDHSYIFSSRGCPYLCTFCSSTEFWKKFRANSVEYVMEELNYLKNRFGTKTVNFYDDLFISDRKRLKKISEAIHEQGLDKEMNLNCSVRANLVTEDLCKDLQAMNITGVNWGTESNSEKILRYYRKTHISPADNQNTVDLLHSHGIECMSSFIIGAPGEDHDDYRETYNFIKRNKNKLKNADIYVMIPMPGTVVWNEAIMKGLVSEDMDWDQLEIDFEDVNFDKYIYCGEVISKMEFYDWFRRFQELHYEIREKNFKIKDPSIAFPPIAIDSNNPEGDKLKQSVERTKYRHKVLALENELQERKDHLQELETYVRKVEKDWQDLVSINEGLRGQMDELHNRLKALEENSSQSTGIRAFFGKK
jgi:radical SAM superfamily enzyme YgiQ (UPF0313 family)